MLGLTISIHKNVLPTTEAICLGININTITGIMSVPDQKLEEIKIMVKNWTHKTTCTKNQLQSLLGSLLYISKCVKNARFFLNRLLETLRGSKKEKIITLDKNFHRDIQWFKKFVEKFNGKTYFVKDKVHGLVHLDACLTGMGAIHNNEVYQLDLPENWKNKNIATLEMLNVLVAIRLWSKNWENKTLKIFCDNAAVVSVLNTGKTRDPILAAICRNIFMLCAKSDIELKFAHIRGEKNIIADLLSRWKNSNENFVKLEKLVPNVVWLPTTPDLVTLDFKI